MSETVETVTTTDADPAAGYLIVDGVGSGLSPSGLRPFDPMAICPKCKGDDIWVQWRSSQDSHWPSRFICLVVHVEHIDRGCRRCKFEWNELPLDSPQAPS